MLRSCTLVFLCGCSEVLVPPDDGTGGGGSAPSSSVSGSQVASSAGTGGSGGNDPVRTIVVDVEVTEGIDADSVVVLLSAPDGQVTDSWLGGELPIETPVTDGDLVSYVYMRGTSSTAQSFRITPAVTEVRTATYQQVFDGPCDFGDPMTVFLEIPQVENGNVFDLWLAGAYWFPVSGLGPGTNEIEVRGCPGTTSFDLLIVPKEYSNTDPLAFARIDSIAYVPGTTITLPIAWSTERSLVDIIVEAEPETLFRASGFWHNWSFGGFPVTTSTGAETNERGTAMLTYGPFAVGPGNSRASVAVPPFWSCELDMTWKVAPFDGAPLHARIGALAGFAPAADSSVSLASDGEIGDVMTRTKHDYESDTPSYWKLHEDPVTPYPLPVPPDVPQQLLPGFIWPAVGEIQYTHEDHGPIEGYAEYVKTTAAMDGRARYRVPDGCP